MNGKLELWIVEWEDTDHVSDERYYFFEPVVRVNGTNIWLEEFDCKIQEIGWTDVFWEEAASGILKLTYIGDV